jgi:tetratricopeptide (TPR) repeat protein
VDGLIRDLRLGLRLLFKDKAFTATVLLTLGIAIGANTALFTVVHHVILRPLPVPEPDRILLMSNQYPKAGAGDSTNSGVPDYFDRRKETNVYEEQALFNRSSVSIGQDGLPTRIRAMNATPSFFRLLRVPAALGRTFTDDEGEIGQEKKVVLSDTLWKSQFGSDPAVVGRELRLDGQPYSVVGVMPKSIEALSPGALLWRPLAFTPEQKSDSNRHSNNYSNIGRLKRGASLEQAQAQVNSLNAANLERFPQYKELLINAGFHTSVERFQDQLVREVKPTLYLLWGGALFVLLIASVNVANLVLVRARIRGKELATRLAIGAARAQVVRQLVADAEKSYTEVVKLAELLPPGDENLIVALGRLGNTYGMRQDYADGEAAFHRQLTIIEKTFGPGSPRMTDPLFSLGSFAGGQGNFVAAEGYFSRALDINVKNFGENSARTAESLRAMAGLYMAQQSWQKAEPYLVRAVKAVEVANGPDDGLVLVPLWGLCDLYDRMGKADQSQPCWRRATGLMEKQSGENSPGLIAPLTNEAKALRRLGRNDEAEKLEHRLAQINRTTAQAN